MKSNGRNSFLILTIAVLGLAVARGAERGTETATFGAGCFWGVEAAFQRVKGVTDTTVGYMGGASKQPTYEQVSTHRTGHTEVCQVTYDPAQVSYERLVEIFFQIHDPAFYSSKGGDGVDRYRSVIFFHNAEQERIAGAARDRLQVSGKFNGPIGSAIVPVAEFWRAEEYHQRYAEKHHLPVCQVAD